MKFLKISVNISIRPGDKPDLVLEALKKIDYPVDLFEIIIIEGNYLTKQRNRGIRVSSGDVVYLLDNDSMPKPDSLKIISKEFGNRKIAAVGGPSLSPKIEKNYLSKLIGYVLETYFGAFRMRHKWSQQKSKNNYSDYAFIGCNLALRKEYVIKVGGFDEKFQANDETELLRRLTYHKFILKYNKKLIVYRNQRRNIIDLIKQFHHYGKGRMKHILKNPKLEDLFLLTPIFFVIYILSLNIYISYYYLIPLVIYVIFALLTSLKAYIKYHRPDLLISMTLLFPVIHFSYAFGLINELLFGTFEFHRNITTKLKIIQFKNF